MTGRRTAGQWYHFLMVRAGFVLVGGQSRRMGRDKALLPCRNETLAGFTAAKVAAVAGSAALLGDPQIYGRIGYPVYPDLHPGCGPIGGLEAALESRTADWNLLVACDLPLLTAPILRTLFDRAIESGAERGCAVATGADQEPQPLCAVYHSSCLPAVRQAILEGRFKMKSLLTELAPIPVPVPALLNVNTPEDWAAALASL